MKRLKPKMSVHHYDKAIVVDCPLCKVKANICCVRVDGKNGRIHRDRVLAFEDMLRRTKELI